MTPTRKAQGATDQVSGGAAATSLEVREQLVEALKLDLVGPWKGHALEAERLPRRERPSNWYLAGFLIPAGTAPAKSADVDEDDDMGGEVPESAGLTEESNDAGDGRRTFRLSRRGATYTVRVDPRWIAHPECDCPDATRRLAAAAEPVFCKHVIAALIQREELRYQLIDLFL